MGKSMVSSPYVVLSAFDLSGKAMVDHHEANVKALSGTSSQRNSLSQNFWTETLAAHNLESPGYHETVQKMKELGLIKHKDGNSNK